MTSPALAQLIAQAAKPEVPVTAKSKRPKGQVKVSFQGQPLFSHPIWADATSENEITNQLNDLCLNDREAAVNVFMAMLKECTVEITLPSTSSATSLTDLLGGLATPAAE